MPFDPKKQHPPSSPKIFAFAVGALLALALETRGILPSPSLDWALRGLEELDAMTPHGKARAEPLELSLPEEVGFCLHFLWPLLGGGLFRLLWMPRYTHCVFRREQGSSMIYGNVSLNRNGASRGHFCTGKTGGGKTQIVLNHLLHSRFVNEGGRIRKGWLDSDTAKSLKAAKAALHAYTVEKLSEIAALEGEYAALEEKIRVAKDAAQSLAVRSYLKRQEAAARLLTGGPVSFVSQDAKGVTHTTSGYSGPEIETRLAAAKKGAEAASPPVNLGLLGPEAITLAALEEELAEKKGVVDRIHYNLHLRRLETQSFTDAAKPLKYEAYPWGGCCFDEKGLFWQTLVPMATHYDREDDLMLLQTRPDWAGSYWQPPSKFNLLSEENIDADTYAKIIVDTAMSVEGTDSKDPFFPTQGQIQIGWAIKLMRAARAAQLEQRPELSERDLTTPSLLKILEILTVRKDYDRYLYSIGAAGQKIKVTTVDDNGNTTEDFKPGPPLIFSPRLTEAMHRLTNDYWAQPEEQRGGVTSTIYNYLVPFAQPDVAEVFCGANTFDLKSIEQGKIVCIAMPQKLAVQRRYVATIIKQLFYTTVERRFDGDISGPAWQNKNFLVADQDEAQSFAIARDGAVDKTREANGTTFMLTQTHMAIYKTLGGKEKGSAILANLANRYICGAALEECAEESAKIVGKEKLTKTSKTYSSNGVSTSESEEERYILPPLKLKGLPDFHCYFVPCEGVWLYKLFLMQPVTPEGRIPKWWFGSYDPIECIQAMFGNDKVIPFWAAKAPFKMHLRHLLGKDTTFIELDARKRQK